MNLSETKDAPSAPKTGVLIQAGVLIKNSDEIIPNGVVVVDAHGSVAASGPPSLIAQHKEIPIWHAPEYICMPGLINAHTHVALSYTRGFGHGHSDMIEKLFFTTEKNLTEDLVEGLAYGYLVDGLRSGTTCFGDHYYFSEGVAKAMSHLGVRGVIGETIADLGSAFPDASRWQAAKKSIEGWRFGPLIQPLVAPHAADSVSPSLLTDMASFAKENRLPLHMHLAQNQGEWERVKKRDHRTPVQTAAACGALGESSLLAHLIHVDDQDIELIAKSGATYALCPSSQILFNKLAPIDKLIEAGIPYAVATDCAGSCDHADLLSEVRTLKLLSKTLQQEMALSWTELFDSITETPAKALGIKAGSLNPGNVADLCLIKRDLTLAPEDKMITNLIFSAASRNVEHVMVDGRWVLWNRQPVQRSLTDLNERFTRASETIHELGKGVF